jgi:Domain of unknown function (DUF1772)
MPPLLDLLALVTTGLFAGAALYITIVEHPARVECGVPIAVAEFRPSYRRAAVMQASLAVIGTLAALGRWWSSGGQGWLVGGLLLGAVILFTLVVVLPTNRRLLVGSLNTTSREAAVLLRRWGHLHVVRTVLSVVAFLVLLWAAGRR